MIVKLNGELKTLPASCSLAEALNFWGCHASQVTFAVAVNLTFVPHSEFVNKKLQENDEIEMVAPMQGG